MIQNNFNTSSPVLRARKWEFWWLCGLILSFAYELPIWFLTSYDRVNPRLFDVMFFLGVLTVLRNLRREVRVPPLFRIWAAIVGVFCFCALIWAIGILPWEYGKFSLFFAGKYVEGLIVIYIAAKIPLDTRQKRIIHCLVIAGGVFVALYSIPQYNSGATEAAEWAISGDKTVSTFGRVVFGPLSRSYFHIGIFSTLSFAMAFALVPAIRRLKYSWLCFGLAFFVAWPALVCGARAAIVGVGIVLLITLFLKSKLIAKVLLFFVLGLLLSYAADVNVRSLNFDEISLGAKRLQGESGHNSISKRVFRNYSIDQYMWDGLPVPFIGAGFYVAPVDNGMGSFNYRVGYGIHNAYLFAFEQGGLAAFLLYLLFLTRTMKYLNRMRNSVSIVDSSFAFGLFTFMAALLVVAFGGQVFWRGFETGNLNTYIVLLLVLATSQTSAPAETTYKKHIHHVRSSEDKDK